MEKKKHRIKVRTTLAVAVVAALMGCVGSSAGIGVAVDEHKIRGLMDENRVAGMAVVLVKGDKVVYQQAFGYRDKDTREPLDINDIFRIASISKSFSGVSIMQLVEAGKLSLDDDVNDILGMDIRNPRYPDIPVTIRMLLSHTSSMNDGGGYSDLTYIDKTKTDIKLIREKAWLPYPPGKGYKYCNRALNIIGLVIEKVSGERFDEYVLNHILKPIGADNAGFNLDTLDKSTFTKLYTYDKKRDRLVPGGGYKRINEQKVADGTYKIGTDGCYWSPTGGMKMSAPNLVKWMLTLKNGGVAPNGNRILSEKGCKTLLTPVTQADPGAQYCLTTRIETRFIEGKRLVGHTGSAHGLFSCMYFCPDEDWGFVCICSSGTREKINGIRKAYYQTINLLYDQCIKPSDAHGRKVLIRAPSLTYDAPFPGSDTGRIYYFVPKGLDLTKPAPLLVFMHGGNSKSPDTSPEKYLDPKTGTMMPTLYDAPFIVAAPSAPPVAKGATKRNSRWCQPDAVKYIEATIDAACRKFKIDRDRVFLGGHSMGGFGAYHLAQLMPDRLAGAWLSAGAWRQADFRSMLGTPIFIMHGKSDCSPEKKYIVGTNGRPRPHGWTGVSYARAADELMTRYGVEHVYAEHADGHAINSDDAKEATRRFMEWTKDKRRAPYARKTALVTPIGSWHPTAESVTKVRWLELLEATGGSITVDAIELSGPSVTQVPEDLEKQTYALAPRMVENGARIVAENLGGNRFKVKTENVRRFAILLAPPMGDLSKPFTVQVNGKSRTVLAETLSGMNDYTARLVVDVAAPPASFAYYLPVENSEGRSFRYWADHPLDDLFTP